MGRSTFLLALAISALFCLMLSLQHSTQAQAGSTNSRSTSPFTRPAATASPTVCTYTPFNFSVSGLGSVGDVRPFTTVAGESYLQFYPAPPITTTEESSGALLANSDFAGGTLGAITGTFAISNLNGIAITGSTISPEARGFLLNEMDVSDQNGSMRLLFAVNYASTTEAPPYYPRSISGFVYSSVTTGAYAPYRFAGTITGNIGIPSGNNVPLTASISGKLFAASSNTQPGFLLSGSRVMPPLYPVALSLSDYTARFRSADAHPATTQGYFNPISTFVGNTNTNFTSTFTLDNHSLLEGNSLTLSPGWFAGNFRATHSSGDKLYAVWLGDLPGVSHHGYMFQVGGTGQFANSLIFGQQDGAIAYNGGQDIATGFSQGYYCLEMAPQGGTSTPTPPASATATTPPSATPTRTGTTTAIASSTASASATVPAPSATVEATATGAPPTATQPSATNPPSSATATATAVSTGTASPTSTVCSVTFSDLPEGSTFYPYVHCLACLGIVNGYPDGTFRPGNNVTRGQLSKIVAQAAGFNEPPGAPMFEDVPPGSTFFDYVQRVAAREIVAGYPCGSTAEPCGPSNLPYFRPGGTATRGQLAKIVANAVGLSGPLPVGVQTFADVPPAGTFYLYVERIAAERPGSISGYACGAPGEPCDEEQRPYFRPGNPVSRGQSAKIVSAVVLPRCSP